jgi:SAM-dependent methyltransferase
MGVKLARDKPGSLLFAVIYRIHKWLPFSADVKLKFYLNLEWVFDRLSHEMSFEYYRADKHPVRVFSRDFICSLIEPSHTVLDLGCNSGFLSNLLADKAKEVVGIDYDKGAIELAAMRYQKPNLNFVHSEAMEYLESQKKKFDVLMLSHILEHLNQPKEFINRFKKYFDLIYIEVPDFDRSNLNKYRSDLKLNLIYSDSDHVTEFDRDELLCLIESCYLTVLKEQYRWGVMRIWCRVNHN